MACNEMNVNETIELVIDGVLTAHDAHVGMTEQHLRESVGLKGDGPAEDAYIDHIEAINAMWKSATETVFWAGYKLAQELEVAN